MTPDDSQSVAERREALLSELASLVEPPPVLVAASKRQPDARIDAALVAGHRVFGENRVQEAFERWSGRRAGFPDLELRLIGPLQTNKADEACALFDVIETLDRPKLARALAKAMDKTGRRPKVFIQVNTGEEPQKSGVIPAELPALIDFSGGVCGLEIAGLMCIPPADEPAGPHFALLSKLARGHDLSGVSMGMSGDYALAARLGASHVRVGTAFFGPRVT
ncbi:MAG: YggS family pyridoxal phosphate-dependent enzyme [Pseudomonadota bacterium]